MLPGQVERLPTYWFRIDILNIAFIKLATFSSSSLSSTVCANTEPMNSYDALKLLKTTGTIATARSDSSSAYILNDGPHILFKVTVFFIDNFLYSYSIQAC